jgi:hypothetical protein
MSRTDRNPKIGHFPYATDHEDSTEEALHLIDTPIFGNTNYVVVTAIVYCPCMVKVTIRGQRRLCHQIR